jgi:hypothetical protein
MRPGPLACYRDSARKIYAVRGLMRTPFSMPHTTNAPKGCAQIRRAGRGCGPKSPVESPLDPRAQDVRSGCDGHGQTWHFTMIGSVSGLHQ